MQLKCIYCVQYSHYGFLAFCRGQFYSITHDWCVPDTVISVLNFVSLWNAQETMCCRSTVCIRVLTKIRRAPSCLSNGFLNLLLMVTSAINTVKLTSWSITLHVPLVNQQCHLHLCAKARNVSLYIFEMKYFIICTTL